MEWCWAVPGGPAACVPRLGPPGLTRPVLLRALARPAVRPALLPQFTELSIGDTRQLVAEGVIAGGMIPKCEEWRGRDGSRGEGAGTEGRIGALAHRSPPVHTPPPACPPTVLCRVECCVRCLAQGVRATHIIDGRQKHSLLMELLTDEGVGTMITG